MAFGTGLHPTTRACIELAAGRSSRCRTAVLDVGRGSGILALAALRLGAERVIGYDTDPLAVEASTANAVANGLGDRFEAHLGTLPAEADEPFPLVLANLVAAVLIELGAAAGGAHRAGWDADGVGHHREPRRTRSSRRSPRAGFEVVDWITEGDWVTVRFGRTA